MTNELTLREKAILSVAHLPEESQPGSGSNIIYAAIIDALEDTGSPAHMRVAAELRGVGRFKAGDHVVSLKDFGPVDGWPHGVVRSADPAFKGAVQVRFKTAIILHQPHELRGE